MNKILKFKGIGLPLGWIIGMLLQLMLFPIILKEFKADASWWIPQLIGLTIMFIIAGIWNRKFLFTWIVMQYNKFLNWLKN